MNTVSRVIFVLIITASLVGSKVQIAGASVNLQQPVVTLFSSPLGFRDGIQYAPRFTRDNNGNLIENTDYGITNPDLSHFSPCFSTNMSNLYHAGQDLYRADGQSTAGAEVTAVADGIVSDYSPSGNYPGKAIVIKHFLTGGKYVYSVYMHLENIAITQGQSVTRGQRLGTIIFQPYDGNFPEYHPVPLNDDSHIHFEMRLFASAANIYTDHPSCNLGDAPGRGYTFPQLPDTFPTLETGYRNPRVYITQRIFLPCIMNNYYACSPGVELLSNGGFEDGHSDWVEIGFNIITNTDDPYLTITPHAGTWLSWLGGRNSANDTVYQQFSIADSLTSGNLSYYLWMGTDETSGSYDKLLVMLRNSSGGLIQQLDYVDNSYSIRRQWVQRSLFLPDLTPWKGQNLRISFEASTNGSLVTNFYIDDVSLAMACGSNYQAFYGVKETIAGQPVQSNLTTGSQPVKPLNPPPTIPAYP